MWRLLCIGLLLPGLVLAQGKGGRNRVRAERGDAASRKAETYPAFRDAEIRLILDFYRPGSGNLPPGIARRGEFPPGIMKQLARGKGLPPGLEKKLEPFPEPLARQFPPPPPGYRRMICGNFALLLQDGTNLVVDLVALGQ
ncbi:MAG: hypothetical protein N2036_04330 [Bryobacteraceae bacterium]|nr:hypothetical protein [Bryobacteraceae bacterium]